MEFIDLNQSWKFCSRILTTSDTAIPPDLEDINLPVDLLCSVSRDYSAPLGEFNSYYNVAYATFYKELPDIKSYEQMYLELSGLSGTADIFINDIFVCNLNSSAPCIIDITKFYIKNFKNIIKLSVMTAQTGKYTGLGVAGGVKLIVRRSKIAISPYGIHVVTMPIANKASLSVKVSVENPSADKASLTIETLLFNAKNKRVCRRLKRVKINANSTKVFELSANFTRRYPYSSSDPYLYKAVVNLLNIDNNVVIDNADTTFGLINSKLGNKGLCVNESVLKLTGAVMSQDNGIIGKASNLSAEMYKLSRIKNLGYNAVRYIGCPSDACLAALDKLGLYALVDIFDVWQEGKFPFDGHASFSTNWRSELVCTILKLRNHPSVIMYSLGNNVGECYNRGGGAELACEMAKTLKLYDSSRILTVNASNLPLLKQEQGEKDAFKNLTMEFFKSVDVAGYSYLYSRYATDKNIDGRMIIGLASYPSHSFEALDEAEKNNNVIGDFKFCGADFLGEAIGKPSFNNQQLSLIPPHTSYCGDLDIIYDAKPSAFYRQILMGNRAVSFIGVIDPDSKQNLQDKYSSLALKPCWNWQQHLGQAVEIQVFSGGEVVALYLNNKIVGRKLAGKINKHIATFKTEYYPGKLEAVSYHKGVECSRITLETTNAPKKIVLTPSVKSITEGELSFIQISVLDAEGRLTTTANRSVEVIVSGEGRLVNVINGDPQSQNIIGSGSCGLYNGKALIVVSGSTEGRINIKVTSQGLLCGKTIIRVKNAVKKD